MEPGALIRLLSPARAGWFEVRNAYSGSGGSWTLPAGTQLRFVGIRNSPPIGSDPLPVPHFEILTGDHAGRIVDQVGEWEFVADGE